VHLVVETMPEGNLSSAMQWLSTMYTRYFNERHQRVGHLYQGRFYSNVVDRDTYLFEVTRYVHLNPFRARLVERPADYLWSSYRIYLGIAPDPWRLVEYDRILSLFGHTLVEQVKRYQQFVDELAQQEADLDQWIRKLTRYKLIPSTRWLSKEVTVTSAAL